MRTSSLVLLVLLGLLAIELCGNTAVAESARSRLEGRLCASSDSGKLIIRKRCKKQEQELTLETISSKGDTGPQGIPGPKGDPGTSGFQDFQVLSCVVSNQSSTGFVPCPNELSLDCPQGYKVVGYSHDLYSNNNLNLHTYYTFCAK